MQQSIACTDTSLFAPRTNVHFYYAPSIVTSPLFGLFPLLEIIVLLTKSFQFASRGNRNHDHTMTSL